MKFRLAAAICSAAMALAAPAHATFFAYAGPSVAIPDGNAAGINIPIFVSGMSGVISDLNTSMFINHTFDSDVQIRLTAPNGFSQIILNACTTGLCQRGVDGTNNYGSVAQDTVFDDQSSFLFANASGPYIGTYTLNGVGTRNNILSAFDGIDPNGTWTVNVSDQTFVDSGQLNRFALDISTAPITQTFSYLGSPVAIVDNDPNGVNIPVKVSGFAEVLDVNLGLYVTHGFDSDVQVTMTAPSGNSQLILPACTGSGCPRGIVSGNNYGTAANDAILDDDAATRLIDAAPPYAGSYNLKGLGPNDAPLSQFDHEAASGTWNVNIADEVFGDAGTVQRVDLTITGTPETDRTFAYEGPKLEIPDGDTSGHGDGIDFFVDVAEAGPITDLDVAFYITHTFASDIQITLTAPDGTSRIILPGCSSSNGCARGIDGGDNYGSRVLDTVLDDDVLSRLVDAAAPYQGRFNLNGLGLGDDVLSFFDGHEALGRWTVNVADLQFGDVGMLNRFNLIIHAKPSVVTPPSVPEPASWAMMIFGLGTAGAALRGKRRQNCQIVAS